MRDHLGIGLRGEHVAVGLQFGAQRSMILDDAVVHDRDLARHVRMCVVLTGHAMGGPTGVGDAALARDAPLCLQLAQHRDLALGPQPDDAGFGLHGDARRIVAAVFQCLQAGDEVGDDVAPGTDAHDSTHDELSIVRSRAL